MLQDEPLPPSAPLDSAQEQSTIPVKIRVRGLDFFYGGARALSNINLDIPEKRITAFIGPSGCGKSTLLRVFNRMFELVSRTVRNGSSDLGWPEHSRQVL